MLTTADLYERPGYAFDIGDRVRFFLLRGLELITNENFKARSVSVSQNPNSNRRVTGTVTRYVPYKPGDLEIECSMFDDYSLSLRLNQCRNLKILE